MTGDRGARLVCHGRISSAADSFYERVEAKHLQSTLIDARWIENPWVLFLVAVERAASATVAAATVDDDNKNNNTNNNNETVPCITHVCSMRNRSEMIDPMFRFATLTSAETKTTDSNLSFLLLRRITCNPDLVVLSKVNPNGEGLR